jgi:hypothetical protein
LPKISVFRGLGAAEGNLTDIVREWEGVEYAFDAMTAGLSKGMIVIGHWVSEDPAMQLCADWLKTFISEVPVEWIPAGNPFWKP